LRVHCVRRSHGLNTNGIAAANAYITDFYFACFETGIFSEGIAVGEIH
jgi:hypothetical protein